MGALKGFYCSSIGAKTVVAVSGFLLFGFLVGHLSGNLLAYLGQDAFNAYAHQLKSLGPLLWVVRLGLLGVFALHVVTTIKLVRMNRAARPQAYAKKNTVQASWASRTMILSGLLVLFFVFYHLAHFTVHLLNAEYSTYYDASGRHDAYRMLVEGFSNPIVVFFYIGSMVLIGLHLSHGLKSFFQTLGWNHPHLAFFSNRLLPAAGWAIVAGFISIPLSVFIGIIH